MIGRRRAVFHVIAPIVSNPIPRMQNSLSARLAGNAAIRRAIVPPCTCSSVSKPVSVGY